MLTPGLTILGTAHIDLEGLTLDREVSALRDQFGTFNWSRILYSGLFLPRARVSPSQHCRVSKECLQGQLHCAWKKQRKFVPVSFSNVASFAYGGHCETGTYHGLFLWIRFILLQGGPFLGLNDCNLQRQG